MPADRRAVLLYAWWLALPPVALGADAGSGAPGSFTLDNLDRSADPCADFYQFACGGWMARNPIPADQARWARFNELAERNRAVLRDILEAAAKGAGPDPLDRQIGDYYASCMDEAGIEAKGVAVLKPQFDRIAGLKATGQLPALLGGLHLAGVDALFGFGSEQDFKDATSVVASVDQGGLGLPDRDYYLKDDAKSAEIRQGYVEHLKRMFALIGEAPAPAATHAQAVMELETELAKVSLERVKRRDPENLYHKLTRAQLLALSPSFAWGGYLDAVAAPPFESVIVAVPEFVQRMDTLLNSVGLDAWKAYLRWHVVHAESDLLPKAFVDQEFAFFGQTLTGQKEIKPRWNRCVQATDRRLGQALGRRYVEKTFGAEARSRMAALVAALYRALEQDLRELPWMTDTTKQQALAKRAAMANKIGAPAVWRDYSSLRVVRGDAIGNLERAQAFELRRQLAKIGKPVDRGEWLMTPPTVNAYYQPQYNDINFPAGILQPPFFDRDVDDAVNYGAIGSVIGHEMTHGFDDQGRKFDKDGNLKDWWTEADAREFEKRASCIADQYAGYTAVADVKLNGRLTLGENTADNGGLRIAHMAFLDALGGRTPEPIDGFTAEQRFFLGYAQVWCQNRTDEVARLLAQIDPHSPGRYRANGVLSNMPEFAAAFGCKAGQPMVRENACRVW